MYVPPRWKACRGGHDALEEGRARGRVRRDEARAGIAARVGASQHPGSGDEEEEEGGDRRGCAAEHSCGGVVRPR